jgi:hypothetical protein
VSTPVGLRPAAYRLLFACSNEIVHDDHGPRAEAFLRQRQGRITGLASGACGRPVDEPQIDRGTGRTTQECIPPVGLATEVELLQWSITYVSDVIDPVCAPMARAWRGSVRSALHPRPVRLRAEVGHRGAVRGRYQPRGPTPQRDRSLAGPDCRAGQCPTSGRRVSRCGCRPPRRAPLPPHGSRTLSGLGGTPAQ